MTGREYCTKVRLSEPVSPAHTCFDQRLGLNAAYASLFTLTVKKCARPITFVLSRPRALTKGQSQRVEGPLVGPRKKVNGLIT